MKTLIAFILATVAAGAQTLPPLPPIASGPKIVWTEVTNVTGYKVYWGTLPGVYVTNWTVIGATNFTMPFRQPGTNVFNVRSFIRQPVSAGSTNLIDLLSDPNTELQGIIPPPPTKLQFDIIVEASADPAGPFRSIGSVTTEVAVSESHQFFRARFDDTQLSKVVTLKP